MRYFKLEEFDSPDQPGSGSGMSLQLLSLLDELREAVQVPLTINSGFRTAEHNAKIGGKDNSAHLRGLAVDIKCFDSQTRFRIVNAALLLNIRRFEIAPHHVHIDIDSTLPRDVIVFLEKYPAT